VDNLKLWLKAARAQFFTASFVPVVLGTFLAGFETGQIKWVFFAVMLLGVIACHAGSNLINDYYDHLNMTDVINTNRSAFNGGSGCIQEGLVSLKSVKKAAAICYVISVLVGIFFMCIYGLVPFLYVLTGVLSGYSYSGYPFLSHRGIGEFLVGLNFGPLIVTGSYFVQTGSFSIVSLVASLPIGLLIAAVLYINQFPDYQADSLCGKRNWVVRLGLKPALPYYYLLIAMAYLVIVLGVILNLLPISAVLVFLTLPFAVVAVIVAKNCYSSPVKILRANALTIVTHFGFGLLLAMVFAWEMLMFK